MNQHQENGTGGKPPEVYVSIVSLRLRSPLLLPRFWWFTLRSLRQARKAEGNLSAQINRIDGAYHSLTVWRDRAAMLAFMRHGAHAQAMRGFPWSGQGRVAGFSGAHAPAWADVPAIMRSRGRPV